MLSMPGVRWVVRSEDGVSYYDELRGAPLRFLGDRFEPSMDGALAPELLESAESTAATCASTSRCCTPWTTVAGSGSWPRTASRR
ncbi:MAG: DUF6177 family protein [Actinomycetota bacterium]|nr:DUF6177 family protein [Actinomycetota bacterium]